MASNTKVQCLVNYYLAEGFGHSVYEVCDSLLKRNSNDNFLKFWKAFAMCATGSASQVCLHQSP
jgi:hypothetical protein